MEYQQALSNKQIETHSYMIFQVEQQTGWILGSLKGTVSEDGYCCATDLFQLDYSECSIRLSSFDSERIVGGSSAPIKVKTLNNRSVGFFHHFRVNSCFSWFQSLIS